MNEEIKINQKTIIYILMVLVLFLGFVAFTFYIGFRIEDKQHAELIKDYDDLVMKYNKIVQDHDSCSLLLEGCVNIKRQLGKDVEYYSKLYSECIVKNKQNEDLDILDIFRIFG